MRVGLEGHGRTAWRGDSGEQKLCSDCGTDYEQTASGGYRRTTGGREGGRRAGMMSQSLPLGGAKRREKASKIPKGERARIEGPAATFAISQIRLLRLPLSRSLGSGTVYFIILLHNFTLIYASVHGPGGVISGIRVVCRQQTDTDGVSRAA